MYIQLLVSRDVIQSVNFIYLTYARVRVYVYVKRTLSKIFIILSQIIYCPKILENKNLNL